MEKTLEKTLSIINENERVIAQILHDVKSPLYSIKIALQNKLDSEINKDIFNTTVSTLEYIENFLINYSFSKGKFENKITLCNLKEIISKTIENYKYIFIEKNIHIDFIIEDGEFIVNSNNLLLTGIIGNIISNIAFHASKNKDAEIELSKKNGCIIIYFKNLFDEENTNTSLGLDFSRKFAQLIHSELKLKKTSNLMLVYLKIPNLKLK